MNRVRQIIGAVVAICMGLMVVACSSTDSTEEVTTLRLGAIATGTAPEEQARYQAIADQLSTALDMDVELKTSTEYYAIAEGLRGGQLDIAFLNSLGYVLTAAKTTIEPVAVGLDSTGQPGYYSYLITEQPQEIASPADVRGRTLALASKLSTSGYLFPLNAMKDAGIDPQTDVTLSAGGNHAANILAVASGQVDAAFVDSVEYDAAVENGKIDPQEVSVVWKSERITGSPVVLRGDLPADLHDKLAAAVLALTGTPEVPIGVEKSMTVGPITDADYDPIRRLAQQAGLSVDDMKPKK